MSERFVDVRDTTENTHGVSLTGLQTIVPPAAKAGAILRINIAIWKFQGILADMPIGLSSGMQSQTEGQP